MRPGVLARQAHGQRPVDVDAGHDVAVDLAHQHHAGDVEGVGVGDPQPVEELGLLAQPGHEVADLGPAAVDDHRPHADRAHEHDVLGEEAAEGGLGHGRPAVLDDHDLAPEAADVGQGLGQDRRLVERRRGVRAVSGYGHDVPLFSSM